MPGDEQAPATKQDIRMLMEEIGKLYDANERWKDEVIETTRLHFDVAVEHIRHDLEGAHKDKLALQDDRLDAHDVRIGRLERHAGLAV